MAEESKPNLERSLRFGPTFMIGVGTMLGAGIFVFPGLAGGRTGGGAAVSFALGGLIAFIVALAASELATSMPRSGGIVNFADRAFGRTSASIVGLAQWAGLVFSIGFYLLGFGHYATKAAQATGYEIADERAWVFGVAACAMLTVLALFDTGTSGRLQKVLVAVLLVGLLVLVSIGLYLPVTGVEPVHAIELAPNGTPAIFSTAALVFTSYLGFVQIANVAGDVVKPKQNLPKAMIGSVVLVTVLYVLVMLMSSLTFSPMQLEEMGETAIVEIAQARLGQTGRAVVLVAGFLATLSSANAAILSTSRTLFALGRDNMVPGPFAKLSRRGTPRNALLVSSAAAAGLLCIGELELLAEAASLLHLGIYSAICFAVLRTRTNEPPTSTFRVPLYPGLPVVGGIMCLAMIAFFSSPSQLVAAAVVLISAAFILLRKTVRQ